MKRPSSVITIVLSLFCALLQCQTKPSFKHKKVKILNREFTIPNINKKVERLSLKEKETLDWKKKSAFDIKLNRFNELEKKGSLELRPDTTFVSTSEFDRENNILNVYSSNLQSGKYGIITYYDSDSVLNDARVREEFLNAQPMRYSIVKSYFSNGVINTKRLSYSSVKLKEYEYNESGKLVSEFEHNKKYKMSPIDVLKILEQNNIFIEFQIDRRSTNPMTLLSCMSTNYGKIWHLKQFEESMEYIIFDDSGKVVSQKTLKTYKKRDNFLVINKATFDLWFPNKSIKDVENEIGLKLFYYSENN